MEEDGKVELMLRYVQMVLGLLCDFGMIIGPLVGYVFQYRDINEIKALKDSHLEFHLF